MKNNFTTLPVFLINKIDLRSLRLFAWLRMTTPGRCHIDHLYESGIKSAATIKKYALKLVNYGLAGMDEHGNLYLRNSSRVALTYGQKSFKRTLIKPQHIKSNTSFQTVITAFKLKSLRNKKIEPAVRRTKNTGNTKINLPETPKECVSVRFAARWLKCSKSTAARRLTAAKMSKTIKAYKVSVPLDVRDENGFVAYTPSMFDLGPLYEEWPWLKGRVHARYQTIKDVHGQITSRGYVPFLQMPDRIRSMVSVFK